MLTKDPFPNWLLRPITSAFHLQAQVMFYRLGINSEYEQITEIFRQWWSNRLSLIWERWSFTPARVIMGSVTTIMVASVFQLPGFEMIRTHQVRWWGR